MKALLLFHIRVGVRVAVRSFIPLFAGMICLIMFQINPAAVATNLALSIFAPDPIFRYLIPAAVLALLFPMLAAPKLSMGLNGWMRHLCISRKDNRHGLMLGLAMAQIPLGVSLLILGVIASLNKCNVWPAVPRLCILLAAAVFCALPVYRRPMVVLPALVAVACALTKHSIVIFAGVLLLIAAELVSGNVREIRQRKPWSPAESLFEFRVCWRALGSRLPPLYIAPLLIIGMTALFVNNNELGGSLLAATVRFGGCMGAAIFTSSVAVKLAALRPAWPWARSFPTSSFRRIGIDTLFLGLHAVPLLIPIALINVYAMWFVLFTLPLLSLRSTEQIRKVRERSGDAAEYVIKPLGAFLEAFGVAALLALLPWTVAIWIAATIPAFYSARKADIRQKVSRWLDMHYAAAGDPLNWSNR